MTAAHSIPDVLVSKITLMAYALSPHPLATMIKDSRATWDIYCQSFIPWGSKRVKWINQMNALVTKK